ncbi:MAG: 5-oxoprolinase subunit PxpA [Nakamurella sp.]
MSTAVRTIDLNADMGESYGRWVLGDDAGVMQYVTTVNIATGFHAGDPTTMRETVGRAVELDLCIGGHVAWPDLMGFGRRRMTVPPSDAQNIVLYQLGALDAFVRAAGGQLGHVKPHGALYVQASTEPELARALWQAVAEFDDTLPLLLLDTRFAEQAADDGIKIVGEGFPDLNYDPAGQLIIEPRKLAWDPDLVGSRAVDMATKGVVVATDGTPLELSVDSLCIHGDAPNGVDVARVAAATLTAAGIVLATIGRRSRTGRIGVAA